VAKREDEAFETVTVNRYVKPEDASPRARGRTPDERGTLAREDADWRMANPSIWLQLFERGPDGSA
jgi:hypothetical protein